MELASHEVLQRWFERLDKVLKEEAQLSGLIGHSTMTGDAREFLINRVLKTVLPPSVHAGTGAIIGQEGTRTKQIDVVLYDNRFPVLETQKGHGLYLAEGVFAAIEVKSVLNKPELELAMDNCASVGRLKLAMGGDRYTEAGSESSTRAYYPPPCSYLFAFKSTDNHATLGGQISGWWEDRGFRASDAGVLPEVIAAGSLVGYRNGRWMKLGVEGDLARSVESSSGKNACLLMCIAESASPFGHFVSNLLFTLATRNLIPNRTNIPMVDILGEYLPMDNYLAEINDSKRSTMVSCPGDEAT